MPRLFLLVALLLADMSISKAFVSEISMKKIQPNRNSVVASSSYITTSLFYENPRDLKLERNFEVQTDNSDPQDDDCKYDKLVESHPLDDTEPIAPTYKDPEPPKVLQRCSDYYARLIPNPYGIPENDTDAEFEWFRKRLKIRRNARRLFDGDDSAVQVVSVHGSKNVEDALLRHWMAHQRRRFMKTLGILDLTDRSHWGTTYLTEREKELLDAVGFSWAHLQPKSLTNEFIYSNAFQKQVRMKYKDWIWSPQFEELKQSLLQQENGDGTRLLPGGEGFLGRWASEQRRLRWEMPERRRALLDDIQFNWDDDIISLSEVESSLSNKSEGEKPPSVPFAKRMSQLKEYRLAVGSCNVPLPVLSYYESNKSEVPDGLGEWVHNMKSRRADLAPRTVLQFERLGFDFDDA